MMKGIKRYIFICMMILGISYFFFHIGARIYIGDRIAVTQINKINQYKDIFEGIDGISCSTEKINGRWLAISRWYSAIYVCDSEDAAIRRDIITTLKRNGFDCVIRKDGNDVRGYMDDIIIIVQYYGKGFNMIIDFDEFFRRHHM